MAPSTPDLLELRRHTRDERERLADLLGGLRPDQWEHPSLCAGWSVAEVAAHLTLPFRTSPLRLAAGLLGAGLSFDRFASRDARRTARTTRPADLVALMLRNVDHPWSPPGGGPAGALSHDLVHGLDVTVPLGLPAAPVDRVALVVASTTPRQVRYFGVDLDGVQLVATDAEVSVGTGTRVARMPVTDILLTITGRAPAPARGARGARR